MTIQRKPSTDEEIRIVSKFDEMSKRIHQGLNSPKGGTQAEDQYSIAYQSLVRVGLAMQIKKKYR